MSVRDDGRGLDDAEPGAEHGHLGLQALADIATEHSGSLELWSAPGAGTEVRVELAL
jgi:signal transduction histidine kinase